MITMIIVLDNGVKNYQRVSSLWAGRVIGTDYLFRYSNIEKIYLTDSETGEVYDLLWRELGD